MEFNNPFWLTTTDLYSITSPSTWSMTLSPFILFLILWHLVAFIFMLLSFYEVLEQGV